MVSISVLALLVAGAAGWWFYRTLQKYFGFGMTSDFAAYIQTCWFTSHGDILHPLRMFETFTLYAWQLTLILAPVGLLYHLAPYPATLLAIQALAVASGAIPIYRLACRHLKSPVASLLCAAIYLLYPPLHLASLGEFYPDMLAVPAFCWLILSFEERNMVMTIASLAVGLSCKQALAILAFGFGVSCLRKPTRRFGLWIAGLSLGWLLLSIFAVQPLLAPGDSMLWQNYYAYLGKTPREMLKTLIQHPGKVAPYLFQRVNLTSIFQLLAPLIFLPLLQPRCLFPVALYCLPLFLSEHHLTHVATTYYFAPIAPFMIWAAICAMGFLSQVAPSRSSQAESRVGQAHSSVRSTILAATLALICFFFTSSVFRLPKPSRADQERVRALQDAVASVPADAAVTATIYLLPHLCHREWLYALPLPRSFGKDRVKLYLGPSQRVPLQAARKLYFVVEKMPFAAPGYRRLIEQDVALLKRQSGISVLKENRHVIILRYKPPSPR